MYENEADKETMLVTIGEYKELVKAQISLYAAIDYLAAQDRSYSNLEPLYCILGVQRHETKDV